MAVATFDSTIHFYMLRPSQTQPQMLVVPDIAEPYAPPAASVICNAKASRHVVRCLRFETRCPLMLWCTSGVAFQPILWVPLCSSDLIYSIASARR